MWNSCRFDANNFACFHTACFCKSRSCCYDPFVESGVCWWIFTLTSRCYDVFLQDSGGVGCCASKELSQKAMPLCRGWIRLNESNLYQSIFIHFPFSKGIDCIATSNSTASKNVDHRPKIIQNHVVNWPPHFLYALATAKSWHARTNLWTWWWIFLKVVI